jgi:hypothetical protein
VKRTERYFIGVVPLSTTTPPIVPTGGASGHTDPAPHNECRYLVVPWRPFSSYCERGTHERLGARDALVLARRTDEDAHVQLAFDAPLEGLAVDLGGAIELEDLDLMTEHLLRRHDVRQEVGGV